MRPALALLAVLAAVPAGAAARSTSVLLPDGEIVSVESARTPAQRAAALKDRDRMEKESGILFEFPGGNPTLDLSGVAAAMDLLVLEKGGAVTSIAHHEAGGSEEISGKGRYILALDADAVKEHGLRKGAVIRIGPPPVAPTAAAAAVPQETADSAKTRQDLMDSIESMKGKVPDALYQQMAAQGKAAADELDAHPDEPAAEVVKKVTGIDFDKLTRRAAELKQKDPKMTDEEVARIVASELILTLPKPDPAPASKP